MLLFRIFIIASIFSVSCFSSSAQESNNGKRLWAKSILNEQAPKLVVEKWMSKEPATDGKFILIDFWATWCPPCRQFIPILNKFQKKFRDKLVVIGLSDEPAEKIESFTGPKSDFFEAIDTKARLKDKLEVKGIPHAILISPKGTVIWEGFPFEKNAQLTDAVLEQLIKKYENS